MRYFKCNIILSSRAASYLDRGWYAWMTPVENRVVDLFSRQISLLSVFFTVRVTFIVDLVVGRVGNTSAGASSSASNAMCVYHCRCMVSRTCTCVPESMPVSKRVVSCDLRYVTVFLVPDCVGL